MQGDCYFHLASQPINFQINLEIALPRKAIHLFDLPFFVPPPHIYKPSILYALPSKKKKRKASLV